MAAEPKRTYQDGPAVGRAVGEGRTLAASMPRLILEARRVAATVIHGLHGRRRAGPGENFWQYRRFVSGEPASRVDWRRSARDDHLYVREQEWEAAHTVWIWPDRSPSMAFASPLVRDTKLYRTLVVALALAEILVQGGERVGIPGLMQPTGSRNVVERIERRLAVTGGAQRARVVARLGAPARRVGEEGIEQPHQGAPLLHGTAELVHRVLARALGVADGGARVGEDSGGDRTQRGCNRRLRPQGRLVAHVHFYEAVHDGSMTSFVTL